MDRVGQYEDAQVVEKTCKTPTALRAPWIQLLRRANLRCNLEGLGPARHGKSGSLHRGARPRAGQSDDRALFYGLFVGIALATTFVGCSCEPGQPAPADAAESAVTSAAVAAEVPEATGEATQEPPALLFLPDAATEIWPDEYRPALVAPMARCPLDMVDIGGRFCIDRYEARLVDIDRGRRVSPYYPPR